jgi:hypothetical protein
LKNARLLLATLPKPFCPLPLTTLSPIRHYFLLVLKRRRDIPMMIGTNILLMAVGAVLVLVFGLSTLGLLIGAAGVLGLLVTLAMSASSPEAGEIAQRREEQCGDPYIDGMTNKL